MLHGSLLYQTTFELRADNSPVAGAQRVLVSFRAPEKVSMDVSEVIQPVLRSLDKPKNKLPSQETQSEVHEAFNSDTSEMVSSESMVVEPKIPIPIKAKTEISRSAKPQPLINELEALEIVQSSQLNIADVAKGRLEDALLNAYINALQHWVASNQKYPRKAKKKQHQGVSELGFFLNAEGEIEGINITKSSGFVSLDKAALNALQKSPPPSPPDGLDVKGMKFTLPVAFALL